MDVLKELTERIRYSRGVTGVESLVKNLIEADRISIAGKDSFDINVSIEPSSHDLYSVTIRLVIYVTPSSGMYKKEKIPVYNFTYRYRMGMAHIPDPYSAQMPNMAETIGDDFKRHLLIEALAGAIKEQISRWPREKQE